LQFFLYVRLFLSNFFWKVLMESTNGGRGGSTGGGATNGTNGESHGINGVDNGHLMLQVRKAAESL
jgi:hypothetical protein